MYFNDVSAGFNLCSFIESANMIDIYFLIEQDVKEELAMIVK